MAIASLVLLAGCVEDGKSRSRSRALRPEAIGGKPQPQQTIPQQQRTAKSGKQRPEPRTPETVPATSPPTNSVVSIHLSAGAALPQPLPQGTTMTFSAEYQFRGGGPNFGVRYVLVITDRRSRAIKTELRSLNSRGQLPALFTRQFRPEDAPFQAFIEEHPVSSGADLRKPGKRVSNTVPLR